MTNIEQCKSEDLGCQVQDANPGNFAIEQEVAQLVGATVPAPTEPSADDARELGAQLLVFLRRALLPIRSALRTAVAAIYAHLDSRCTDYTPAAYASFQDPSTVPPYDPMRPLTPRTLPNLLTALTAFSARKISNGSAPNDGIPDGMSLAQLLCCKADCPTKIIDDNAPGWVWDRNIDWSQFPSLEKIVMNCGSVTRTSYVFKYCTAKEIICDYIQSLGAGYQIVNNQNLEILSLKSVEQIGGWDYNVPITNNPKLREVYLDGLHKINNSALAPALNGLPALQKAVFGDIDTLNAWGNPSNNFVGSDTPCLILLSIGAKVSISLDGWAPATAMMDDPTAEGYIDLVTDEDCHNNLEQFLQNFKNHIALRLTANGSGKTLTLSQAVRNAIHAAESTYGIENIIVTQKGWTISPAPN